MSDKEIVIPQNAGLSELRSLLAWAQNEINKIDPKVQQYRIDQRNAKSRYEDALSSAKIIAMRLAGIKPNHQTAINTIASDDMEVKQLKQAWLDAEALEIKAIGRLQLLQGNRDTIKCMIKSEQITF